MAPRAEEEELTGQWRPLWVIAGDGETERSLQCVDCREIKDQRESDWDGGVATRRHHLHCTCLATTLTSSRGQRRPNTVRACLTYMLEQCRVGSDSGSHWTCSRDGCRHTASVHDHAR